jgi:hypothetical protein
MAKRRHTAALFEVFHNNQAATQRAAKPTGWWFKGRTSSRQVEEPLVLDENDPTTMTIRSPLIAPRIAAVEAMDDTPDESHDEPPARPAPVVRMEVRPPVEVEAPSEPAPRRQLRSSDPTSTAYFHIDPESRDVSIRLPFKLALMAAFAIVLFISIAYVLGRRSADSQLAQATQESVDEKVAKADVHPSVIDLPRRPNKPAATAVKPAPRVTADESRVREREATPMANSVHGIDPVAPPEVPVADGPRVIGLNYLIIQSYPNEATAIEVRDFLRRNGVACTVEKVPRNIVFNPDANYRAVITLRGFGHEQLHSSEYEAFKRQLDKLGEKLGKGKRFALATYQEQ